MSSFLQGDLVIVRSLKIPYSGGVRTKEHFPHGYGIVSYIDDDPGGYRIHLLPVHHKISVVPKDAHGERGLYANWLRSTYKVQFGRLRLKNGETPFEDNTWYFHEDDLVLFVRFADVKYFDDDLFRMD